MWWLLFSLTGGRRDAGALEPDFHLGVGRAPEEIAHLLRVWRCVRVCFYTSTPTSTLEHQPPSQVAHLIHRPPLDGHPVHGQQPVPDTHARVVGVADLCVFWGEEKETASERVWCVRRGRGRDDAVPPSLCPPARMFSGLLLPVPRPHHRASPQITTHHTRAATPRTPQTPTPR